MAAPAKVLNSEERYKKSVVLNHSVLKLYILNSNTKSYEYIIFSKINFTA